MKLKQNHTKVSWNINHGIYRRLWDVNNVISNFLMIFCIFRAFLQPKRPIWKIQKNRKNRDFRQNLTFPTNDRYGPTCIYMAKNGPLGSPRHVLGQKTISASFGSLFSKNENFGFFPAKIPKFWQILPKIWRSRPVFGQKILKSHFLWSYLLPNKNAAETSKKWMLCAKKC